MSNYHWIIDAGHGGLKNGYYTTCPNKMYTFEDGFEIYEGVVNRAIASKLWRKLASKNIDFSLVYDEIEDTSLKKRVQMANKAYVKDKRLVFLSIHSNAGKGSGNEVWTSIGETKSDVLAEIFCNHYKKWMKEFPFRQDMDDGDPDKEEDFYVLRYTLCPALLVENLFFDNRVEAEYLTSEFGQERIAECLFQAILEIENTKPI